MLIEAAQNWLLCLSTLNWRWSRTRKSRRAMPIEPRLRSPTEACSLSPCGGPQWTRVRSGRRTKSSGLKPRRRTSRFIERNLPGPQKPTGRRSYAPNASFEMFRDWQENTHSIFCDGLNSPIQRMDVWFCVTRRNRAERHNREVMNTLSETTRRSPERYGKALPHLSKDLSWMSASRPPDSQPGM